MKNLILDNPVDEHLKPVKDSDGTSTAIELSTEKVRVQDLEVTGSTTGVSASDDTKLPLAGGTMTGNVDFGDNDITNVDSLDADKLSIAGGTEMTAFIDADDMSTGASATTISSSESIKSYVDTNRRWSIETGGYRSNNNSSTIYYFQYRPNGENWSNTDSSIASISVYDSYASMLVAPYDGKVTKISVHGYANDTGAADPLKFYVFKGTPSSGGTNVSLTQIGVTGTINPVAARQFVENTDISSSNTFSENDAIYVMYKKDSTSGNQDLYFSITVSGEYTS
mgnify:CR=1 FL=1